MIFKIKARPFFRIPYFYLLIVFCLLAVPVGYHWVSHPLIEAMYHGKAAGFLNTIIKSQSTHPLEYYLEVADREFTRFYIRMILCVVCILFFSLWYKTLTLRRFWMTVLILILGQGLIFIYCSYKINFLEFRKAVEIFSGKVERIQEQARAFSPDAALKKAGNNSFNGFYYRLDENWKEASLISSDKTEFKKRIESSLSQKGVIEVPFPKGALQSLGGLELPDDEIGKIEIRMRVKKARKVSMSWRDKTPDLWIDTLPGSVFYTYSIDVGKTFNEKFKAGEKSKEIFLKSEAVNDEVEIEFLRLLTKKAKYAGNPLGETYEVRGQEMRRSLFFNTPLEVSYLISLPLEKVRLSFGTGLLAKEDPVTFQVSLEDEEGKKEVFREVQSENDRWKDHAIDLSGWRGKKVKLTLKAGSSGGNVAFWAHPAISGEPKRKFNVVIILEDALRADHLSSYGYERPTAPFKGAVSEQGALFLNAFSQSLITRSSCASFMTSLYSTANGVWNNTDNLDDHFLTLAEIMSNQGFETASFIQNENGGPDAGLHQGFNSLFRHKAGKRAKEIYGKPLQDWIESHSDRNFFLYLHLIDPHSPYDPPQPYDQWAREVSAASGQEKGDAWSKAMAIETKRRIALYDGEIRANDDALKEFWEWFEKKGLTENTLFIFMSDHGEYFGEHGFWGHGQSAGYLPNLHVPLIMYYPDQIPGKRRIKAPVQLLDIMPTILEFAGIDRNPLLLQGDSLRPLLHGEETVYWNHRLVFSEELDVKDKKDKNGWGSLFFDHWHFLDSSYFWGISKYRESGFRLKIPELGLASKMFNFIQDPREKREWSTFSFNPILRLGLARLIRQTQTTNEEIRNALTHQSEQKIITDPEVQERLRSLGYLN